MNGWVRKAVEPCPLCGASITHLRRVMTPDRKRMYAWQAAPCKCKIRPQEYILTEHFTQKLRPAQAGTWSSAPPKPEPLTDPEAGIDVPLPQ